MCRVRPARRYVADFSGQPNLIIINNTLIGRKNPTPAFLRRWCVGSVFLFHVVWSLYFNVGSYCFPTEFKTRKATPPARRKELSELSAGNSSYASFAVMVNKGKKHELTPLLAELPCTAVYSGRNQTPPAGGSRPNGHRRRRSFKSGPTKEKIRKEGSPRGENLRGENVGTAFLKFSWLVLSWVFPPRG